MFRLNMCVLSFFFFFNDTATTEIYTLSLHDALPIWCARTSPKRSSWAGSRSSPSATRSEEHTSELQSRRDLVCRLLLEKKKKLPTTQRPVRKFLFGEAQRRRAYQILRDELRNKRQAYVVFFFNDTATTEIYTLSLHDALPI